MEKPISSPEPSNSIEFQDQRIKAAPLLKNALDIQSGLEKSPRSKGGKQHKLSLFADYFQSFESYLDKALDDFLASEKKVPGGTDRGSKKKRLKNILDDKRKAKAKANGVFRGRTISVSSSSKIFKNPKLIRDGMKKITKEQDQAVEFHRAGDAEFFDALKNKLVEEVQEFSEARAKEEIFSEISDIQEVMSALLEVSGVSLEQVGKILQSRKSGSGESFSRRVLI